MVQPRLQGGPVMPISSFGAAHVAAALAALTGAAVAAIGAALRLLSSAVTIAGAPLCSGSGSRLFVAAGSAELTRGLTAETRTGFQPMAGPASNRAPVSLENAPVPTYNTRRKLPFGCPVANGISRIQTGPNRFFTPRESLVSRNAWASAAAPLHSEVPRSFADTARADRGAFRRMSQINRTALPAILSAWRSTGLAVRISSHATRTPSYVKPMFATLWD